MADFGRSCIHGSLGSAIIKKGKAYGVTSYMDPKILIAVLFWQLTSCRPPFEFETDIGLEIRIINGKRETPISNTNDGYV
jgi:hypothetical protein